METVKRFKVTILDKGKTRSIEIDKESCVLGRSGNVDILIDHELISRRHLKIILQNEVVIVEELGSSNGSWLDGVKLEAGKKSVFREGSTLSLGNHSGVMINIINLSVINSQSNEATLIRHVTALTTIKKVSNGLELNTPPHHVSPDLKIVKTDHTQNNSQKSLENHVKLLAEQESKKLREAALKEVSRLKIDALQEKENILELAKIEAEKIIEHSKVQAFKIVKTAESSAESISLKSKRTEENSDNILKTLKNKAFQYEEKIKRFIEEDKNNALKVKNLEEEYTLVKEKTKKENLKLEELKNKIEDLKKNFNLKIEEYAYEERRIRAKNEAELAESNAHVSRIYIEVEKAQIQRDLLSPELQKLKSDKDRIEREINEAQINYKRYEYELEKITKEYHEQEIESNNAKNEYENFLNEIKFHKDAQEKQQKNIDDHEKIIKDKIQNLEDFAKQAQAVAHKEAANIIAEAKASAKLIEEKNRISIRDLEIHRKQFFANLEDEKSNFKKIETEELNEMKISGKAELDKIEQKKSNTINEIKWLEENANSR